MFETIKPDIATATQKLAEGHDTAFRRCPGSMLILAQLSDAGFVLLSTLPDASTATHSEAVGQETPVSARASSIDPGGEDHVRVLVPALTNTCPRPSTAKQGPPWAHETALRGSAESMSASVHDGRDDAGSIVPNACPLRSTATHSVSEAHDTALGVPLESNAVAADQLSGAAASADVGASDAARPSSDAARASTAIRLGRRARVRRRRSGRSEVLIGSFSHCTLPPMTRSRCSPRSRATPRPVECCGAASSAGTSQPADTLCR